MTTYNIEKMENGALLVSDNGNEMEVMDFTERNETGVFGDIIVLEDETELYPNEWNGEIFIVNGKDYRPVYKADEDNSDNYETVGYVEVQELNQDFKSIYEQSEGIGK